MTSRLSALDSSAGSDRRIVLGAAMTLTALLWAWLVATHVLPSHHSHGAGVSFPFAFAFWTGMMAAMMLPAVLPWIALAATVRRGGPGGTAAVLYGFTT